MKNKRILYLSKSDILDLSLDMGTVLQLVEKAFVEKAAGRVESPSKIGIHPRQDAFLHAMPANIPGMKSSGIKWISSYPTNIIQGIPNINGLIVLNDPETGIPICIMDCAWITASRTGAATALSARFLARPNSQTVGIIACGAQGRANLEALTLLFPIKKVFAYDISIQARDRFVADLSLLLGVEIIGVNSVREAVEGCDLVVTSGPIQKEAVPTIEKGWLKPGGFASSVDFGSYWTSKSLLEMDRITTDDFTQFNDYRKLGYFSHIPDIYSDLTELVSGRVQGRCDDSERTIAINLGLAMEDIAVASEIYRRANKQKIGTWLKN